MSRALLLLWLCFVVRGFYYTSVMPLWEGFDEHSHFAFVQHVLNRGALPIPGVARISHEVNSSLRAYPVPRALRDEASGAITYEGYRALPEQERERLRGRLSPLKTEDPTAGFLYESQQPPLYYWLMTPPLAIAESLNLDLPARVSVLRAASILLCSLALPLGWALARRVLRSDASATGVVAIAVCMPEFMISVARVGNESLAVLLFTLLACGAVWLSPNQWTWRVTVLIGLALGCGMLTKSYFLTAIPAVCLIFVLRLRWRGLLYLPAALALAAGISLWWYAFIYRHTGDITGQIQSVALKGVSWPERFQVALHLNWWRAIDTALFSHLWIGGWSFLQVRSWMYHLFYAIFLAALIGLVIALLRGRVRPLLPLAALEVCFCASLAYHAVLGQIGYGNPMTNGWYLYCLVFAEVTLVCVGLSALLPRGCSRWIPPALAAMFALLDVYGLSLVQIPYYAGLTGHAANGRVVALGAAQLPDLARHLGLAWAAYLLATIGAVWVALVAAHEAKRCGPAASGGLFGNGSAAGVTGQSNP